MDADKEKLAKVLRGSTGVSIRSLGEGTLDRVSTGNYPIDYVLGGGMPIGRMVELFGAESTGKSTLAIQTSINLARKTGKPVVYLDYEGGSFVDEYAKALGAEDWMFLVVDPISRIEDGAKVLHAYGDEISGFVWDSVAAAVPSQVANKLEKMNLASQDNPYSGGPIGTDARAFSSTLKLINGIIRRNNLMAIFINQLRTQINTMGPSTTTTPGGRALKFYASIRVEIRRASAVQGTVTDPATGRTAKQNIAMKEIVSVAKNKTTDPFRSVEVLLTHGHGFDEVWSLIQAATAKELIKMSGGGYYKFEVNGEAQTLRGAPALREYLDENPDALQYFKEKCGWI